MGGSVVNGLGCAELDPVPLLNSYKRAERK